MNSQVNRQLDMLVRVNAFGENHKDLFLPGSVAAKQFAIIAAKIPELSKFAGSQSAGFATAHEGVISKGEARENLRSCIETISRTARAIGRSEASIGLIFKLPKLRGDRALIADARAFAENAKPLKDIFVAHELSPDFITELAAATTRFEQAITDHASKKGARISATATLEETMDSAMDAAYVLAGILPNKLQNDYPTLMEWMNARRIASPRSAKASEPEAEPPIASAAAA